MYGNLQKSGSDGRPCLNCICATSALWIEKESKEGTWNICTYCGRGENLRYTDPEQVFIRRQELISRNGMMNNYQGIAATTDQSGSPPEIHKVRSYEDLNSFQIGKNRVQSTHEKLRPISKPYDTDCRRGGLVSLTTRISPDGNPSPQITSLIQPVQNQLAPVDAKKKILEKFEEIELPPACPNTPQVQGKGERFKRISPPIIDEFERRKDISVQTGPDREESNIGREESCEAVIFEGRVSESIDLPAPIHYMDNLMEAADSNVDGGKYCNKKMEGIESKPYTIFGIDEDSRTFPALHSTIPSASEDGVEDGIHRASTANSILSVASKVGRSMQKGFKRRTEDLKLRTEKGSLARSSLNIGSQEQPNSARNENGILRRCQQCLAVVSELQLMKHIADHFEDMNPCFYRCLWCLFSCNEISLLLNHYASKHFRCPFCRKFNGQGRNRLAHIASCRSLAKFHDL